MSNPAFKSFVSSPSPSGPDRVSEARHAPGHLRRARSTAAVCRASAALVPDKLRATQVGHLRACAQRQPHTAPLRLLCPTTCRRRGRAESWEPSRACTREHTTRVCKRTHSRAHFHARRTCAVPGRPARWAAAPVAVLASRRRALSAFYNDCRLLIWMACGSLRQCSPLHRLNSKGFQSLPCASGG